VSFIICCIIILSLLNKKKPVPRVPVVPLSAYGL
jgi:hypothetical protein